MAPLLNELLEQAASEAVRLTEEVQAAGEVVDATADRAGSLASGAIGETENACGRLNVFGEALGTADQHLESVIQQMVKPALEHVDKSGQEVRAKASHLLEMIRSDLHAFEQEREHMRSDLEKRLQGTHEQFDEVAQAHQKLQATAQERAEAARNAVLELRTAVEQGREQIATAQQAWTAGLDQIEATARAQSAAFVTAVGTLLEDQTTALIGLANAMVTAHNHAMVDVRKKFTEEVPARLEKAAETLTETMDRVRQACEDRTEPVETRTKAVRDAVTAARSALESLRTAAASVEPLQ